MEPTLVPVAAFGAAKEKGRGSKVGKQVEEGVSIGEAKEGSSIPSGRVEVIGFFCTRC